MFTFSLLSLGKHQDWLVLLVCRIIFVSLMERENFLSWGGISLSHMVTQDILVSFVSAVTCTASFLGHLKIGICSELVLGGVQFWRGSRKQLWQSDIGAVSQRWRDNRSKWKSGKWSSQPRLVGLCIKTAERLVWLRWVSQGEQEPGGGHERSSYQMHVKRVWTPYSDLMRSHWKVLIRRLTLPLFMFENMGQDWGIGLRGTNYYV